MYGRFFPSSGETTRAIFRRRQKRKRTRITIAIKTGITPPTTAAVCEFDQDGGGPDDGPDAGLGVGVLLLEGFVVDDEIIDELMGTLGKLNSTSK